MALATRSRLINGAGCKCNRMPASVAPRAVAGTRTFRRFTRRIEASGAEASTSAPRPERLTYDHLLLTILDSNPDLSSSSWQAVATAADLAALHKSRVTVLVVDEKVQPDADSAAGPGPGQGKLQQQANKIANTLTQMGVQFDIVERQVVGEQAKDAEGRSSVVVGEVADEVEADLLVLHSQAVHQKALDANLLAEFVSCPVLLLP